MAPRFLVFTFHLPPPSSRLFFSLVQFLQGQTRQRFFSPFFLSSCSLRGWLFTVAEGQEKKKGASIDK